MKRVMELRAAESASAHHLLPRLQVPRVFRVRGDRLTVQPILEEGVWYEC